MAAKHVVVIGGGIAGVASAVELLRDGHLVTLLDPGPPGGEQAASHGNGTILNPGSVVPMSAPGIWRKVPGYLMDPLGPLTIRWGYLPRLLPWLARFLRAGSTAAKVSATARALAPLLADAPQRHRRLAEEAGVGGLIQRHGILYPYLDRAAFEAEDLSWQVRRENGITWSELDEDALRQQEPLLDRRYRFGVLAEQAANVRDPGAYVAALAAHAEQLGMAVRRGRARGFRIEAGRLRAVTTDAGEIACDAAVVAAGARSAVLARAAGDKVSLETERGYHIVLRGVDAGLRHPLLTSDTKVAVVQTEAGLRVAGTVELAGLDAAPDPARTARLREILRRTLPGLADVPEDRVVPWMGHRPSTPDGVPVIGRATSCADVVYGFGHGHVGLAAGAMTGRLVADLVSGKTPTIEIGPFSPQRFQ